MGIVVNLFKRMMRREQTPSASSLNPRLGAYPMWQYFGGDMTVAAVFRCVRFISESVASLPLLYQSKRGDVFTTLDNSNLHYLLTVQPNICQNAFDLIRQSVQQILMQGNAYILPEYQAIGGRMELVRLTLCSPGSVSHDTDNDIYNVQDPINRIYGPYMEHEIIHLKNIPDPVNPKRGISTIAYARKSIQISAAADSEQLKRFQSGGIVRGILSNRKEGIKGFGKVQDEELSKAAEDFDARINDPAINIVSIPDEADFKQLSMSSSDMQFLESRKFGVLEICRFFGVHPSFVFSDTSANYKSVEQANVAFLNHTLNPLLRNIEMEFQRKLIGAELNGKMRIQFDRKGIYACDLEGLMKYRNSLLQTGCSVNELRRMENLPPVAEGDSILVSANLKTINELTNYQKSFGSNG